MPSISVVRLNLLERANYRPYCGMTFCWNRIKFDASKKQFYCHCGYVTKFDEPFIDAWMATHGITESDDPKTPWRRH